MRKSTAITVGSTVTYHGSIAEYHGGTFTVASIVRLPGSRRRCYQLAARGTGRILLSLVHRRSITLESQVS
jgi:hypothetical protein